MKHHGNYTLPTPADLSDDLLAGGSVEYIKQQMQRIKKKHHNAKRHKEKRRKKW